MTDHKNGHEVASKANVSPMDDMTDTRFHVLDLIHSDTPYREKHGIWCQSCQDNTPCDHTQTTTQASLGGKDTPPSTCQDNPNKTIPSSVSVGAVQERIMGQLVHTIDASPRMVDTVHGRGITTNRVLEDGRIGVSIESDRSERFCWPTMIFDPNQRREE